MKPKYSLASFASLAFLTFSASAVHGQTTGTWNYDGTTAASLVWNNAASWTDLTGGLVPNAVDATATMGPVVTDKRTVTLNIDVTLGSLVYNEDTVNANSYSIPFNNAARTLTFDVSSGNASIVARGAGGYQLGTPGTGQIILNDNLEVSAGASGAGASEGSTVNLNSQITGTNALILSSLHSIDGSGTAVNGARGTALRSTVANTFDGGVTVNSGYVKLVGNNDNLGSGALTLNSSDSSNGGLGTGLVLRTGGGTVPNDIVLAKVVFTGGSPHLAIQVEDSAVSDYTLTGSITGSVAGLTTRIGTTGNANNHRITFEGDGSGLDVTGNTTFQVRSGTVTLNNANALSTGNGNGNSGRFQLGNFSNTSNSTSELLTNGFNVGGNIINNSAGTSNNDNIIVGGIHTTGTATFSGTVQIARIVAGPRQFQLTSETGGTTEFSGVISDGGGITAFVPVYKVGGGVVSLTNANTYAGNTTVNEGILLVNNIADSGTGTGSVTVAAGATLGGTGIITGAVTAPGIIAPGNGIGTLTADGGVTLSGSLDAEVNATSADSLVVTGDVNLTGAALNLTSLAAPTVPSLILVSYSGTLTGNAAVPTTANTFASVTGLPSGYALVNDTSLKQIRLEGGSPSGNYNSWAAANGVTGGVNGDSDNDGVPNSIEYALNTNLTGSDGSVGTFTGNTLSFTKRQAAIDNGDVTYVIETSPSLAIGSWTPQVTQVPGNPANTNPITYTLPTGQGKIFGRLQVTIQP